MKKVITRYDEEEGLWHVILVYGNGEEADIATHCDEDEAEDAANEINRWSQT